MAQRLAVVTGASAGIGAAIARAYAQRSYDVALVARRADRLQALAEEIAAQHRVFALPIVADLSQREAPERVLAALEGRAVDALVNNAGAGMAQEFERYPWAEHARYLQLMVASCVELIHRVLPGMRAQGFGRIINVASVAGMLPGGHGHTLYGASKAFLIKLSQSLHIELEGSGVHVSAVCPGLTHSEFHDVNGTREAPQKTPAFLWSAASEVAEAAIAGVEANTAVVTVGRGYRAAAGLLGLLPDGVALAIARGQSRRFRPG